MIHDLEGVPHTELVDRQGVRYIEFRKGLRARYWKVGLDILLGYLGFLGVLFLLTNSEHLSPPWKVPAFLFGSFLIGYLMAYLQLFIHEGAHYNIARSRPANDLLTNIFVGSWVGQPVDFYRHIHWEHHRFLGQPNDSENSYFQALNARNILKALFLFHFIQVLFSRKNRAASMEPSIREKTLGDRFFLLLGILLNLGLILFLASYGHYFTAAAWVAGMVVFFPFFGFLRPLLEHRSDQALADVDYQKVPHGRFTRMFKEGPIGSTMGGAGFSRHLLHHWDPQISYTCLAEMEEFLLGTEWGGQIGGTKTSYWQAFRELWGSGALKGRAS